MLAPPYIPVPIKVFNIQTYVSDDALCSKAGADFVPEFSLGTMLSKTVDGAASNSSMIPINPLVIPAGAAGGAVSSVSDGLDIMSGQHANVYRNCLHDITIIDHSAVVADPSTR